jgi:hypothetical protein
MHRHVRALRLLLPGLLLLAPCVHAQQRTSPPAAPCSSAEHHAFDFWIGRWEVRGSDGKLLGTSWVEPVSGGCALVEHWTGAGSGGGTSLNFYDRATGAWEQTWIGNRGGALHLRGGLHDGRMVLEGFTQGPDGRSVRQRITWSRLDEGRVRQLWESSTDAGASWQTVFDGIYAPRPGA